MSESNGFATPADLFGKPPKRKYTNVEVEGLGKFRIQSLTTTEGIKIDKGSSDTTLLRVIVACCVDADGNRIFSESDIEKLQELPAEGILTLGTACGKYGGISLDEDVLKNLNATPGGSSP